MDNLQREKKVVFINVVVTMIKRMIGKGESVSR